MSNPAVFVLYDETTETNELVLLSSWSLVESTQGLEQYIVELRNSDGDTVETDTTDIYTTSFTYRDIVPGLYIVCVRVSAQEVTSDVVCSDVINVEDTEGRPKGDLNN